MNLENIKKFLPLQNPLYSFLHNNALQVFENENFFDGLLKAAQMYQARTLPSGIEYRQWLLDKTINHNNLQEAIQKYYKSNEGCPITADDIYKIMTIPIKYITEEWYSNEKNWVHYWESEHQEPFKNQINQWFIPWIQSYLDQGLSLFANPYTKEGLIHYFVDSIECQPKYLAPFTNLAYNHIVENLSLSPADRLNTLLNRSGYPSLKHEELLIQVCFYLKGWSGMANRIANDKQLRIDSDIHLNMYDWCSVLLSLHLGLHEFYIKKHGLEFKNLFSFLSKRSEFKFDQGLRVIQECEKANIYFDNNDVFLNWFESFNNKHRYQIWQEALENSFIERSHLAIQSNLTKEQTNKQKITATYLFCIDDREESIRRHLEKESDQITTAGVVGFFGLNMKFKSLTHPKSTIQCPPVVNPDFEAEEINKKIDSQAYLMNFYFILSTTLYRATRTLIRGYLASLLLGPLSFLVMTFRIIRPQWSVRISQWLHHKILPEELIKIKSNFDTQSKADRVKMICKMGGLNESTDFPKYVFIVAHQSQASNNPYRQAYGCGACSGNSGAPNSRLFAEFANDLQVRLELHKNNFVIPKETLFIPLLHDTCSDEIFILDKSYLGNADHTEILNFINILKRAAQKNAQERLKKLRPELNVSPEQAFQYTLNRSLDMAQPRPEYGHAGVYQAIFGPRSWSKNLDLNRQSFLVSYDSTKDPDSTLLKELLIGALPVCANIGLDYFFSRADVDGLGSGSKLPLNITGLLGVMTGTFSDLRIGLAKQMTDIHIPLRMIIYIDSTPEVLNLLFNSHPRLKNLVENKWVHIFCINRDSFEIRSFS